MSMHVYVLSWLSHGFSCLLSCTSCMVTRGLSFPSAVHAKTQDAPFGLLFVFQVESLKALIKDKTEDYSVLLLVKEQCQRDLEDRNEEIDKMASRIRELEQALLSSAEAGRAVTQLEQELQKARKNLQDLSQVRLP